MVDKGIFFSRYGISTCVLRKFSLPEAIWRIHEAGFRIIEISACETHLDPRLHPDLPSIRRALRESGIEVNSVHAPLDEALRIGDPDPAFLSGWRDVMVPSLYYCAEIEAKGMVLHVSTITGPNSEQDCRRGAIATASFIEEELAPLARNLGVKLFLENMVNYGWPRFGCSLGELASRFTGPEFGFCLDIGHANLNGIPAWKEMRAAGRRLLTTHIHSNDGQTDQHWLPSEGVINWPEVEQDFHQAGYHGPFILELAGGDSGPKVLEQTAQMWRHLPQAGELLLV